MKEKSRCLHILVIATSQLAQSPLGAGMLPFHRGQGCTPSLPPMIVGLLLWQRTWDSFKAPDLPPLSFLSLPSPWCLWYANDTARISQKLKWHPFHVKPIEDIYPRDMFLLFSVVCSSEHWHSGNPNADVITSAADAFPHFPHRLSPSLSVQPETEWGAVLRPTQT